MACELWENAKRQGNLTLLCPGTPAALEMNAEAAVLTLTTAAPCRHACWSVPTGVTPGCAKSLGLQAINTPYGELGLVANFDCQRPHRGIARQWFRADGVLAWLPMAGDRISIVWSTR
jgi:2-octaprenylphenol hydroxylase